MEKYLEELNPRQKEAVLQTECPVLIIAGAGAGKTKTLTHRILHLIKNGVAPDKILAITFTNKAAKEMSDRVSSLLSKDTELNRPISWNERPFISTFHSLGVKILRENAKTVGIPRNFFIFDKGDSVRAVKQAMKMRGVDPKSFEPSKILNVISREKGKMVSLEEFRENTGREYFKKLIASIWEEYEKILREEKSLDFDDLLLKTSVLLRREKEILENYQKTWEYLHIDEYQDTNKVQYIIAKTLAGKNRNICVVGDIDQNIYSWRGADIQNILNFEKDYPEAKVILLEENYRSTQNILTVANKIIAKNKERREKNLFTRNPVGEKIGLFIAYDEANEASFTAAKAKELIENGVSPKEIAVLFRTNFQSRAVEEAFMNASLPYQVVGVRFFERKEVKDVVAYLRAALNPESPSDLKRIINVPPRGIGKVTFAKIALGQEKKITGVMVEKIKKFRELLQKIEIFSENGKISDTLKFIVEESGLEKNLKEGDSSDEERLENIKELVTFASRYDGLAPSEAIERFTTDVALASDQDELMKENNAVKIMTVHASKGLEFDYVFITGMEEDLFPHAKISEEKMSKSEAEEERRLFYVAITRARKKVYLSYANVRTIFGMRQVTAPSEFIFDIDEEFLENEESLKTGGKVIYFD